MKLKTGDTVYIIAGKDRGKKGDVTRVLPSIGRVSVSGVGSYKRHTKASAQNPQGGVVTKFRPIDASNVMIICPDCNKPTRIGIKLDNGVKTRVCRRCDAALISSSKK